ncbi:MAG TPA: cell division protein ZapA [Blastocatellia bacterium]|nr:cell division protein ZapA [Blastocatellia bacterium]
METTPAQTVKVEIYNQTYNIRSRDGDTEHIKQLAAFVDSRMNEIAAGTLTVDSLKLAILAALQIADELHRMKERRDKLDQEVGERSSHCVELLDNLLKNK